MMDSQGGASSREGLFSALKNTIATLIAIVKTRAELLVTELEEEKLRLLSLCAKALGAAFFLALGIILAVICVAVAFWEQRVLVFALLSASFVAGGFLLIASLRRDAAKGSRLFHASLAELESDMAQLRRRGASPE